APSAPNGDVYGVQCKLASRTKKANKGGSQYCFRVNRTYPDDLIIKATIRIKEDVYGTPRVFWLVARMEDLREITTIKDMVVFSIHDKRSRHLHLIYRDETAATRAVIELLPSTAVITRDIFLERLSESQRIEMYGFEELQ